MIVSGFAFWGFFGDLADRGSPVMLPAASAAPATPVHTPEKPKLWWPLKRGRF